MNNIMQKNLDSFRAMLSEQGGNGAMLLSQKRWVGWRLSSDEKKIPINISKPRTKHIVPVNIQRGSGKTVCLYTYAEVISALNGGICDGIGIATGDFDGVSLTGIDIDNCIDSCTESPIGDSLSLVEQLANAYYCELSPSHTGIHAYVLAEKPINCQTRVKNVEIYDNGQFLTITGIRPIWAIKPISSDDTLLNSICRTVLSGHSASQTPIAQNVPVAANSVSVTDNIAKLHERMRHDRTLANYWHGMRNFNGDESRNDMALMGKLAYYLNCDKELMIDIFMLSPLALSKDEEHIKKLHRDDYLSRTADKAIANYSRFKAVKAKNEPRRKK